MKYGFLFCFIVSLTFSSCFLSKKQAEQPEVETVTDNRSDALKAQIARGQVLFTQQCGGCHGKNATGNFGPNLVDAESKFGNSVEAMTKVIREGIPNTKMPTYEKRLSSEDISNIISFIYDLRGSESQD